MNEKVTNQSAKINLTEAQLDMLKEIGNIGSGHAITALSEILNKNVEVWAFKYSLANALKEELEQKNIYYLDDILSRIKMEG